MSDAPANGQGVGSEHQSAETPPQTAQESAPAATPAAKSAAKPAKRAGGFFQRRSMRSPTEKLQPEAAPPPPPPPPSKRRPTLSAVSGFMSFLLVLAVGALLGLVMAQQRLRAPGPLAQETTVTIARGSDVAEMMSQLERAGVIDSPLLMQAAIALEGSASKLRYGEYLFKQHVSLREVIDTLVQGRELLHSITIPEGLTSEQIVMRLRDSDLLSGEIKDIPKEGSLLPETYRVSRGLPRADLIKRMQDDQRKLLDQVWARRSTDIPVRSPYELLTLASIVEKETGKADERPRVAGVFSNRLKKRMRLQSDPTIVYGIVGGKGTLGRGILRSEVEKYTPYNTYAVEGLPPTPIANPGRAALEAVAHPSRTNELYFVADGTGGHVFAETLDQHNRNVQRWRQIERDAREKPASDKPAPDVDRIAPSSPDQRGDLGEPANVFGALSPEPEAQSAKLALAPDEKALGGAFAMPKAAAGPPTGSKAAQMAAAAKAEPTKPETPRSPRPLASFSLGPGLDETYFAANAGAGGGGLDGASEPMGSSTTYPVAAHTRAAQRAAAAKYGLDGGVDSVPLDTLESSKNAPLAGTSQGAVAGLGHKNAFDASEGTDLDPLRDKSWDLNSAKVVPSGR